MEYSLKINFEESRREGKENLLELATPYLDYSNLFVGDLILKNEEFDFSTQWGWVPLRNIAANFASYVDGLKYGKKTYLFTANECEIYFELVGGNIRITTNYIEGEILVEYSVFRHMAYENIKFVTDNIVKLYPELSKHPAITDMIRNYENYQSESS